MAVRAALAYIERGDLVRAEAVLAWLVLNLPPAPPAPVVEETAARLRVDPVVEAHPGLMAAVLFGLALAVGLIWWALVWFGGWVR